MNQRQNSNIPGYNIDYINISGTGILTCCNARIWPQKHASLCTRNLTNTWKHRTRPHTQPRFCWCRHFAGYTYNNIYSPISVNCTGLVHRIPFLNSPQKPIWEPATALFHKLFVVDCSDRGIQELADCWLSSSLTTSTKHLISAIIHMENQMSI